MSTDTPCDDTECPTCGRTDFKSAQGMKLHHARTHGESIATEEVTCDQCGDTKERYPANIEEHNFCSVECQSGWLSENWQGEDHPHHDRVEVICRNCGDTYETWPSVADTTQYCSKECQSEWQSENIDNSGENHPRWDDSISKKVCEGCGNQFRPQPYRADDQKYCSRECTRDGEYVPCVQCGDEIYEQSHQERRFCSQECQGSWLSENNTGTNHQRWQGGVFPYGKGWNDRKKRRVRIRDQARCQHCGRTEAEHRQEFDEKQIVHHIRPARQVDDSEQRNAMDNLVTLCRGECHSLWEQMAPLRPE